MILSKGKTPIIMKRLFKQIMFFFVSFIGLLAGTELYLRYSLPGWHTARMPQQVIEQHTRIGFKYDRDLMWYWEKVPSQDQSINEFGFRRDKVMSKKKPAGIKRVIYKDEYRDRRGIELLEKCGIEVLRLNK